MKTQTQAQLVYEHMLNKGAITALDALNLYGCFRLAARVKDLRDEGIQIDSEPWRTHGGALIAKYSLKQ